MGDFSVEAVAKLGDDVVKEKEKEKLKVEALKESVRPQKATTSAREEKKAAEATIKQKLQKEMTYNKLLRLKIDRRFQKFSFLDKCVPYPANNAPREVLEETDQLQQLELDMQGGEQSLFNKVITGANILDDMWGDGTQMTMLPPFLRLNLKTPLSLKEATQDAKFQSDLKRLVEETAIEYPQLCKRNLMMRWIEFIIVSLYGVHMVNSNPRLRDAFILMKRMKEEQQAKEKEHIESV